MADPVNLPTDLTPMILQGHVLDVLRTLPADSVQCVVTSPPYWGLRAYGTEGQVWGGKRARSRVEPNVSAPETEVQDDAGTATLGSTIRLEAGATTPKAANPATAAHGRANWARSRLPNSSSPTSRMSSMRSGEFSGATGRSG